MNLHHAHLRLRVVAEQHLAVAVLLALVGVVGTAVDLAPVGCRHGEVVGNVDTVVGQLVADVGVEHAEVDALLQGLVAGGIEDVVDHLVEQCLLIDVAVAHNLLHRLGGIGQRVLVLAQNHGLGYAGGLHLEGFHLERRVDGAVVGSHGKLVALLDGAAQTVDGDGVLLEGTALRGVDVLLQIAKGLVLLQVVRGLIERTVDTLVKLLLLHLDHLLDIRELKVEQRQERESHDDGYNPNSRLPHNVGKVNTFPVTRKSFS